MAYLSNVISLPLKRPCHYPHGPLARYVNLGVAHALGMPGTFPPPPRVSDPDMHHGTCVTHVPWCMQGSLTSGFFWSRWWGETFPAFPAHAQPTILRIWQEAHELKTSPWTNRVIPLLGPILLIGIAISTNKTKICVHASFLNLNRPHQIPLKIK